MLIRPVVLKPAPSIMILMLGGLVGGLLALGILYGAPITGWPALDVLRALGGVFTARPDIAIGVGTVVFLLGVTLILPLAAAGVWTLLPGREGTIGGTLIRASAVGITHWIIAGMVLGLSNLVGTAFGHAPGFVGLAAGLPGMLLFAIASFGYGLAVAGIGFMEQGISAVDTIGWSGFTHGATGPLDLGAHRSGEPVVRSFGETPWRSG